MRDRGITHVVLSGNDARLNVSRAQILARDRKQWTLLAVNGRAAVLAWNDPNKSEAANPASSHRFDPDVRAFAQADNEIALDQAPRLPVLVPEWARNYLFAPAAHPVAADEAQAHLVYFDSCTPEWGVKNRQTWQPAYAAGMVGAANPACGMLSTSTLLSFRACVGAPFYPAPTPPPTGAKPPAAAAAQPSRWVGAIAQGMYSNFVNNQDDGPPGAALLAVQAARRATLANPDDARAYMRLYQAYETLRYRTQERAWVQRLPALKMLRDVQMVGALTSALEIQPNLAPAHWALSQHFLQEDPATRQGPFRDLALDHRTEYLNLLRANGPQPGENPENFRDQLEKLEQGIKDLENEVQKNEQLYLVRSSNQGKVQKAMLALQMGLAKKAQEVLLESEYVEMGIEGAVVQLDLLLRTGMLRKVRHNVKDPDAPLAGNLGYTAVGTEELPAGEWYCMLYDAAVGDYRDADQQLEEIIKQLDPWAPIAQPDPTPPVARMLATGLLEMMPDKPMAVAADQYIRKEISRQQQIGEVFRGVREQMNLETLRGLLALEAGNGRTARKHIEKALQMSMPYERYVPMLTALGSTSPVEAVVSVPLSGEATIGPRVDFLARPMALRLEELLQGAKP
jgi:hypothetical protein